MRLELAEKEEWKEPLEKARQNFRLLAEQIRQDRCQALGGSPEKSRGRRALGAHGLVRGAGIAAAERMCEGNKNVCSKCRGQKKSNKPKAMKKKEDARGASVGKRPDGKGS